MESFFNIITPITYWILVIIWLYILIFYIKKIKSKAKDNKLLKLLLLILAIDAFRTLFESMYFGAWYTSLSGIIPIEVFNYLAQPQIVFIPKIFTLITAILILLLIIRKWLPSEIIQKEEINALVERQTFELSETNKKLIKARIKAEENEKKFRALYNNSPDMYVSVSPKDALIKLCNETLIQKIGYSRDEIIGSPIFKMYHEDCMDDVKKAFELFAEIGEVKDQELILKRKDGSKIDVSLNVNSVRDDSGNILHSISSWRDITERKQAEEKIRAAEESLQNTFDISPSIISKANINTGYFIEVNNAVTRILGYSIEEFTSKPFVEFIHPDDIKKTTDEISEEIKGKEATFFENRYLCKDGTYKWISWHGTKADQNGLVTAVGSDISEQKQAESVIRRLSTAVQQSPSVIAITDTKGKLEYVNPKFTELTGYSSAEAIGQKSNILKSGEQDISFYQEMWKTVESGKVWRGQFHNKKKNGELFWEAASISAILNESGEVINFIKIGEDITQQKNTEIELKAALVKAMESDRLKSAFLTNMSHEIRTPMNGIIGFVNLLSEPNLHQDEVDKYASIINKSSKRLLTTINNIIDISKIEAGETVVSVSETYLNNMMDELLSFHSPEAKLKGLSLISKPSVSNIQSKIITDSHKLHGILTNLIKNAIKYSEKGSISFGYFLKKEFIEFYVKDTGIGIPKDRIKAIFNRFEQADIEDSMAFEGSGLGLAISKAYVEMLGGEISVTSDESKGSTFIFTIPYNKKEKKEMEQLPISIETPIPKTKKMNLLIVEDDDVSSEFLKSILNGMFDEIIIVDNGKDAIEICRDRPELDLVLMDIKMPKMDGYTATEHIRKFNKDIIIIAQTAYALTGDYGKAIDSGCNDYVSKPINKNVLFKLINKYMD